MNMYNFVLFVYSTFFKYTVLLVNLRIRFPYLSESDGRWAHFRNALHACGSLFVDARCAANYCVRLPRHSSCVSVCRVGVSRARRQTLRLTGSNWVLSSQFRYFTYHVSIIYCNPQIIENSVLSRHIGSQQRHRGRTSG